MTSIHTDFGNFNFSKITKLSDILNCAIISSDSLDIT